MTHDGRVVRTREDHARGTVTFQGRCSCGWAGDRIVSPPAVLGSAQLEAPTKNAAARQVGAHLRHQLDTLHGAGGPPG